MIVETYPAGPPVAIGTLAPGDTFENDNGDAHAVLRADAQTAPGKVRYVRFRDMGVGDIETTVPVRPKAYKVVPA